jgi:hypothetical protein
VRLRRARRLTPLAAALVLGLATSTAPGQGEPPCAPGVAAQPVFGSGDYPDAVGAALFATHAVTIGAGFPSSGPAPTVTGFSVAPGLTPVSDELGTRPFTSFDGDVEAIIVTGDQPGSYPATVTWTQYDPATDRSCAGSASTTFSLAAPSPPRLTKPRVTGGLPDESTVRLKFPKGADERPLVVRYRAVAKRRFPGPGVRAHTFTVPLLVNPYGHTPAVRGTVRVGGLKVTIGPERTLNGTFPLGPQFTFNVRPRPYPRGTPYGYDIEILQGGRRVTRLRVTGRCGRVGGLVTCKRGKLRLS